MAHRTRRKGDRQSRGSLAGNQQRQEACVSRRTSLGQNGGAPRDGGISSPGAAGAAGFRNETATGRLKPGASGAEEEEQGTDGGAAVTGVSGVSGGGRGTTSTHNTRR